MLTADARVDLLSPAAEKCVAEDYRVLTRLVEVDRWGHICRMVVVNKDLSLLKVPKKTLKILWSRWLA
jgi:hypothetical protein